MATSTPIIHVGVIGAGQIGKHHIETYASKVKGVKVLAVCDINDEEAEKVAKKYDIPYTFHDFNDLLNFSEISAVDVALHNNYHCPVTVAALNSGKDVYCEKPMAGSYVDAEIMYQTAKQTGKKLSIQLSTLFSKEIRAANEIISKGLLGKLYHARSTGFRRRGRPYVDGYGSATFVQKSIAAGGALYDMGVYHIASILYLLGNPEILRVTGKTYQETSIDTKRFTESGYNVEEMGVGFVHLENGMTLDIIESWAVHLDKFESSVILGSNGGLKLDPFSLFWNEGDLAMNANADLDDFVWRKSSIREDTYAYVGPQQHWIAALQGSVPLLPTAELALKTMLISEGIYLSEKLGREVTAEEIRQKSVSTAIKIN